MHRFHDEKKRPWDLALTVGDMKRVKAALGIDLMEPALGEDGKPIPREKLRETPNLGMVLQTDLLRFYDVLWAILEPQAQELGIHEADFGRALAGKSLLDAHAAFLDEWQNFFVQLGRPAMTEVIQGTRRLTEKVFAMADAKIKAFDLEAELAKVEMLMDRAMSEATEATGPSFTASPASSA